MSQQQNETQSDLRIQLHQLLADPDFIKFHELVEEPNIFNIVGQKNYERWHSGFWAWLLDIEGTHGLGSYALELFILHAITNDHFKPQRIAQYHSDFLDSSLLYASKYEDFKILPNERGVGEKSIAQDGKRSSFDIFLTGTFINQDGGEGRERINFAVLVELKVNAVSTEGQATRYANYFEHSSDKELLEAKKLLVYVLPSNRLSDDLSSPIGDDRWCIVTYQSLHDQVLQPILKHKNLRKHGRWVITEYINNLRTERKGSVMAYTKEEVDLAQAIYERHKTTFDRFSDALQQRRQSQYDELTAQNISKRSEIIVSVDGTQMKGTTFKNIAIDVVSFLDKQGHFKDFTLPWGFGTSRFFMVQVDTNDINFEPRHYNGNVFLQPAYVGTPKKYAIETNISRENGLKMLARLCTELGVSWQVIAS